MTTPAQREAQAGLLADLDRFRAFIRRRVADPHTADDILQDALLRATRHLDQLQDTERIDAWFYRIIRHAIGVPLPVSAHRSSSPGPGRGDPRHRSGGWRSGIAGTQRRGGDQHHPCTTVAGPLGPTRSAAAGLPRLRHPRLSGLRLRTIARRGAATHAAGRGSMMPMPLPVRRDRTQVGCDVGNA